MNNLVAFISEYEHLKVLYPNLYFNASEFGEKNLWRISVFGRNMAIIGDAEFFTVEDTDRETAFSKAIASMKSIPAQISDAIAIKASGRKVEPKKKK